MKIAIFSDAYVPQVSGVSVSIQRFSSILAKQGHKVMIFAPRFKGYVDKKEKNLTIVRSFAFNISSDKAAKFCIPGITGILHKVREFGPDVIHIQTPFNMGWVGTLASKHFKIPNIQTYHTYLPDHMVYLRPSKLLGIDKLEARFPKIGEFFSRMRESERKLFKNAHPALDMCWAYTRLAYNTSDLILTPTLLLKKEVEKHRMKVPVEVLSNGIEFKTIPKKQDNKLRLKIVHAGRMGPEKRIDVVIKAMRFVVDKIPKAELHIYGPGPARGSLEMLTKQLKLEKSVVFHGGLPREELLKEYCKYDLFVTASPMETQGLVILEAMAAGLPVVCIRKLAVPEVVLAGKNGFIAKPFVAKEFAGYILRILEDEELRQKLSLGALSMAQSHDIDGCAAKLLGYYRQVCK